MKREDLAKELFYSISIGMKLDISKMIVNEPITNKCENLLEKMKIELVNNNYTNFRTTLLTIVELCLSSETPKERWLLAKAYSWLGAKYRKETIQATLNYLNNELDITAYTNIHHYSLNGKPNTVKREKDIHLSEVYNNLGKAYEGEYEFEKAFDAFYKSFKFVPEYAHNVLNVARIYLKSNRLDEAINLLQAYKKSKYCQPYLVENSVSHYVDDTNEKVISDYLAKYIQKKECGYIYKPRKRIKN